MAAESLIQFIRQKEDFDKNMFKQLNESDSLVTNCNLNEEATTNLHFTNEFAIKEEPVFVPEFVNVVENLKVEPELEIDDNNQMVKRSNIFEYFTNHYIIVLVIVGIIGD